MLSKERFWWLGRFLRILSFKLCQSSRPHASTSTILVSTFIGGKIRDLAKVKASDFPLEKPGKVFVEIERFKKSGDLHIFLKNEGGSTVTLTERYLKASANE
jgi:hypothetical protein